MKIKKRILQYLIAGFSAVVLIFVILIVDKVFYCSNFFVVKTIPASNVISREQEIRKKGGSMELKTEDINGLIELYLKDKKSLKGVEITGAYFDISNNKLSLYVPARYKGINLLFSCRGAVSYKDNRLFFLPDFFRIGKLSLPKDFVIEKLKANIKDLKLEKSQLSFSNNYFPFNITNLKLDNSSFLVEIEKDPAIAALEAKKAQIDSNRELLTRAKNQLITVQAVAKKTSEKHIAVRIIDIVGKIIDNPDYQYQEEANSVKADFEKLRESYRNDFKNAMVNNMEEDTLKNITSTFGL